MELPPVGPSLPDPPSGPGAICLWLKHIEFGPGPAMEGADDRAAGVTTPAVTGLNEFVATADTPDIEWISHGVIAGPPVQGSNA